MGATDFLSIFAHICFLWRAFLLSTWNGIAYAEEMEKANKFKLLKFSPRKCSCRDGENTFNDINFGCVCNPAQRRSASGCIPYKSEANYNAFILYLIYNYWQHFPLAFGPEFIND